MSPVRADPQLVPLNKVEESRVFPHITGTPPSGDFRFSGKITELEKATQEKLRPDGNKLDRSVQVAGVRTALAGLNVILAKMGNYESGHFFSESRGAWATRIPRKFSTRLGPVSFLVPCAKRAQNLKVVCDSTTQCGKKNKSSVADINFPLIASQIQHVHL